MGMFDGYMAEADRSLQLTISQHGRTEYINPELLVRPKWVVTA